MSDFKKKSNNFYALLMLLQPLVEIVSKSTLVKYSAGLKSWHLGRLLMNVTDRGGGSGYGDVGTVVFHTDKLIIDYLVKFSHLLLWFTKIGIQMQNYGPKGI